MTDRTDPDRPTEDDETDTRAREGSDGERTARDGDAPETVDVTTVSDDASVAVADGTPGIIITTGDESDSGTEEPDAVDRDLGLGSVRGGPQDHLGMVVEPDAHLVDIPGHQAPVDGGGLLGSAAGSLPTAAHDPGAFDRNSVINSPRDDERTVDDDGGSFDQQGEMLTRFGDEADRPSSLYDNPQVVGEDRAAMAAEAAEPDLTGLVDMDGIIGGQVGGTIDGRSPDGGAGGQSSGFAATSGWGTGNVLDGATSQALTDPFAAASTVQRGIADFGHGGFSVYDAHTGAAVYGPGVSAGNGSSIAPGSGAAGEYITVQKGGQNDGQATSSSSSPLSPPVTTSESDGVRVEGGESAHADSTALQKFASWLMQGSSTSPKAEALQQAVEEIDAAGAPPPPPEVPDVPDDGPETEMPADPDAGGPPPAGLDLSHEWAISVWARENADVNPNPMGDGLVAGAMQPMDIGGFVEQYDEAQVAPSIDPEAALDAHRDSIGEQFTEFDG